LAWPWFTRLQDRNDAAAHKIAESDTPACTFGLKLHAEVSQTAIMTAATVATAGKGHW